MLSQDTEMRLPVRATSGCDFEAKGQVFFALEPLCMPFKVDFTVGRRVGVWPVDSGIHRWMPSMVPGKRLMEAAVLSKP